jgi:transposase-like protein
MPPAGPKKTLRYSLDFKRKAVGLTRLPGMQVQTVAKALDIHPFMLSRWRSEARDGVLRAGCTQHSATGLRLTSNNGWPNKMIDQCLRNRGKIRKPGKLRSFAA